MKTEKACLLLLILFPLTFALVPAVLGGDKDKRIPDDVWAYQAYKKVVDETAAMVSNAQARRLASKHGLNILNVTWEDTGRFKNSAVGPNISDMTIQVQQMDSRTRKCRLTCMPVIRYPNFSDVTGDLSLDKFFLLVGNEDGKRLTKVSLRGFLGNIRKYLSKPKSWKGDKKSLLAERDSHVLVSAQACFLPIPKRGKAEFNPVLFNYQSYKGDPAVLTILVTREGTSVTVIDNKRNAFKAGRTWGQRLFFNKNGKRASLTGKRLSDTTGQRKEPAEPTGKTRPVPPPKTGLNMVLLIQVPLKQKNPMRRGIEECGEEEEKTTAAAPAKKKSERKRSDVEEAVIGHGRVEGPFTEIDDLEIERDPKFPIRVTVQFYKATSNGVVSAKDMREISEQISKVYKQADYVGSLVVEGETSRPTEHDGEKVEPPNWWESFWKRYEENTGTSRDYAIKMLRRLHGPNWYPRTEEELKKEIAKVTGRKK
jgi:hypothetical protein